LPTPSELAGSCREEPDAAKREEDETEQSPVAQRSTPQVAPAAASEPPRPPQPPTDADITAAAAGDERAFALLYLEVQPRLRRYATTLVGREADDVTAEAWLQIARDLRGFSGGLDDFRAWTARIVRNRAMDAMRARARRRLDPVPVDQLPPAPAPDDPETAAIDAIATVEALALIATLPADQAEAVLLQVVVGLDGRAAAAILNKTPGAVRVARHRGVKTLAKRLSERGR
jgi:RNA polymerase sigma-70 factor (ECF subfamily)